MNRNYTERMPEEVEKPPFPENHLIPGSNVVKTFRKGDKVKPRICPQYNAEGDLSEIRKDQVLTVKSVVNSSTGYKLVTFKEVSGEFAIEFFKEVQK